MPEEVTEVSEGRHGGDDTVKAGRRSGAGYPGKKTGGETAALGG